MAWGILAVLLSAAFLGSPTIGQGATAKNNPFFSIVKRNAFALRPQSAQIAPAPASPALVEVFLTGVSTLGGKKEVLLQITDKTPGKKTEFPPPLVEGGVWGRVKVMSIVPGKGAVVISIDGAEQTLTFEKNAPKQVVAAAPRVLPSTPLNAFQRALPSVPATTYRPATGVLSRQNVLVGGGGGSGAAFAPASSKAYGIR